MTKPKKVKEEKIQENHEMEHLRYVNDERSHLSDVEIMWMWRDYWDRVD